MPAFFEISKAFSSVLNSRKTRFENMNIQVSVVDTKVSSAASKSSFATPTPLVCSTGDNGFLTTYSTYRFAHI